MGRAAMANMLAALLLGWAGFAVAATAPDRPVHRFLELAISPDGSKVASVEGDVSPSGGLPVVRSLVIRQADGAGEVRIDLPCGAVRECWPSSPAWSPDGGRLVFALRRPGTHARSIYAVRTGGSQPEKLLDFDGTISDLKFSHDGQLAMLAVAGATKELGAAQAGAPVAGDLDAAPPEQRIAILGEGALKFASPPDLFVYEYDWRPGGAGFVGTAAPGDGDNNWWVAKLYGFSSEGARVLFTPPDARHQIAEPRVSPDGRTVAFISGLMSDFGSTGGDVFVLPLAGPGAAANVTPGMRASAATIGWDCEGRLMAELLAGGETRIAGLALNGGAPATQRVLWSGEESVDGEAAGVSMACPTQTTAAVHQTFSTAQEIEIGRIGAWRDLTHVNAGLTAPLTARSLTWTSDGRSVQGWLLLPLNAAGKLPMVTIVHGGPAAAVTPGFIGPGLNRTLLSRGYALFLPNARGSFGQGEAFTQANVRDLGHGDLRDILAGIDAAERGAPIDEGRLGVTGGSYGGFMTMWAVTQTHRFKAGIAVAGISNWQSYYGENGIDRWMIPYFGASVYEDPAIYARSAPISYIRNVTTPVFAYVGAQDIECPPPQTQEFWHALRDLGVPTSIMIYPGEGHGLRDPANLADAQQRSLAWFDKYLK